MAPFDPKTALWTATIRLRVEGELRHLELRPTSLGKTLRAHTKSETAEQHMQHAEASARSRAACIIELVGGIVVIAKTV